MILANSTIFSDPTLDTNLYYDVMTSCDITRWRHDVIWRHTMTSHHDVIWRHTMTSYDVTAWIHMTFYSTEFACRACIYGLWSTMAKGLWGEGTLQHGSWEGHQRSGVFILLCWWLHSCYVCWMLVKCCFCQIVTIVQV